MTLSRSSRTGRSGWDGVDYRFGVLQELLYRYFAVRRPDVARTVYGSVVRLCREILPVKESHTARALTLLLERPGLSARDAIHVATMESAGMTKILSTDKGFDAFSHIERLDPAV